MSLHAFASGCNVIATKKNGKIYGMTCAWATMVDYSYVGMLLGSQSETGNILEVNDIVGVSSLAKDQKDICLKIGEHHSSENKFDGVKLHMQNSAVLIDDAKVMMVCKVSKILHLIDGEEDRFVLLEVLDSKQDKEKEFLTLEEVYPN